MHEMKAQLTKTCLMADYLHREMETVPLCFPPRQSLCEESLVAGDPTWLFVGGLVDFGALMIDVLG